MPNWKALHEDEEGMEAMQTVMVISVAAIICIFVRGFWPGIRTWFRQSVQDVIGWSE